MKFLTFSILTFCVASFSTSAFASTKIEGYARPCNLLLGSEGTVVMLELFATPDEAVRSTGSVVKPQTTVFVDGGPGYEVMRSYPQSKTRELCNGVKSIGGLEKVEIEVNDKMVIEKITARGETLKSDSYLLLEGPAAAQIRALSEALTKASWTIHDLQQKVSEKAATPPANVKPDRQE